MASLVKAVTILSAVLAVGVSCPNGNNPDVIDKVVIGVRGVNNTKDCLLDAPLTRVISNLHNHSLGCPDHEWGCIVNYKFGSRVPNDYLLARSEICKKVKDRQDIYVNVIYPQAGCGKTVSYVEINAVQGRKSGHAKIVEGGIGERYIKIEVLAEQTKYFKLEAAIYGK